MADWVALPAALLRHAMSFAVPADWLRVSRVCRKWSNPAADKSWRLSFLQEFDQEDNDLSELKGEIHCPLNGAIPRNCSTTASCNCGMNSRVSYCVQLYLQRADTPDDTPLKAASRRAKQDSRLFCCQSPRRFWIWPSLTFAKGS